jgi:hypothetical protein
MITKMKNKTKIKKRIGKTLKLKKKTRRYNIKIGGVGEDPNKDYIELGPEESSNETVTDPTAGAAIAASGAAAAAVSASTASGDPAVAPGAPGAAPTAASTVNSTTGAASGAAAAAVSASTASGDPVVAPGAAPTAASTVNSTAGAASGAAAAASGDPAEAAGAAPGAPTDTTAAAPTDTTAGAATAAPTDTTAAAPTAAVPAPTASGAASGAAAAAPTTDPTVNSGAATAAPTDTTAAAPTASGAASGAAAAAPTTDPTVNSGAAPTAPNTGEKPTLSEQTNAYKNINELGLITNKLRLLLTYANNQNYENEPEKGCLKFNMIIELFAKIVALREKEKSKLGFSIYDQPPQEVLDQLKIKIEDSKKIVDENTQLKEKEQTEIEKLKEQLIKLNGQFQFGMPSYPPAPIVINFSPELKNMISTDLFQKEIQELENDIKNNLSSAEQAKPPAEETASSTAEQTASSTAEETASSTAEQTASSTAEQTAEQLAIEASDKLSKLPNLSEENKKIITAVLASYDDGKIIKPTGGNVTSAITIFDMNRSNPSQPNKFIINPVPHDQQLQILFGFKGTSEEDEIYNKSRVGTAYQAQTARFRILQQILDKIPSELFIFIIKYTKVDTTTEVYLKDLAVKSDEEINSAYLKIKEFFKKVNSDNSSV